ncbi:radical SAM protein [candidate division KSB1 bacterium]|nr:radical SAM protein [candidate division KSB1 bacterium]
MPSFTPGLKMQIAEIFHSLQGESTFAGFPCVFIRLSGCNYQCNWCDSTWACEEGEERSIDDILSRVRNFPKTLVQVTGGEPLLQPETPRLCNELLKIFDTVLVETNGFYNIDLLPAGVRRIMDIKCPGSGHHQETDWNNLQRLTVNDEVKFVVAHRRDFVFAEKIIRINRLYEKCTVLVSPVYGRVPLDRLAAWILASKMPVRMQIQLHKAIWGPEKRGV